MHQFKTKAEAQQVIKGLEQRATEYEAHAKRHPAPSKSPAGMRAVGFRADIARIRALLPTLPD